jgi:hypothetical protein
MEYRCIYCCEVLDTKNDGIEYFHHPDDLCIEVRGKCWARVEFTNVVDAIKENVVYV